MVANLLFFVVLFCVLGIGWLAIRWAARAVGRSIKARQDLARGVADLADCLEHVEAKLDRDVNPKAAPLSQQNERGT